MINRDSQVTHTDQQINLSNQIQQPLIIKSVQVQEVPQVVHPIQPQKKQRLSCLDVHRGLTMFGMIMVDMQTQNSIWALKHVQWNGLSPADLVFPSFLFIMGIAVPLAVTPKNPIRIKTIIRTFALILIGLILQLIGAKFDFSTTRIPGILQRLGLCYGAVLLIHYVSRYGKEGYRIIGIVISLVLLAVYLAFMIPFQDLPDGCNHDNNLTEYCNFGAYLDRMLFHPQHMYTPRYDPQGLFTTLNAIVTTYIGYYFCLILLDYKKDVRRIITRWVILSAFFGLMAYCFGFLTHLNKKLYTTSFTFITACVAGYTLSFLLVVVDNIGKDCPNYQKILNIITKPFLWLGRNPLAIFILLNLISTFLDDYIQVDDDNSLYDWIYYNMLASWIGNNGVAACINGLFYSIILTIIAGVLHYYKIFIRV